MAVDLTPYQAGTAAAFTTGKFGQALTQASSSAPGRAVPSNFGITGGAWTIEAWVKTSASTGTNQVVFGGITGGSYWFGIDSTAHIHIESPGVNITGSTALNNGAWHHLAAVSDGATTKLWVDGTVEATSSAGGAPIWPTSGIRIMGVGQIYGGSGAGFNGQIDELRISNTARYTATFTPAAAAFTVDGSTKALYHFDGDTLDATGTWPLYNADSVLYGDAKFGTASFTPSSVSGYTTTQSFGTAVCTIEFWCRVPVAASTRVAFGNPTTGYWIGTQGTTAHVELGGANITGSATIIDGGWHHVAVTHDGTTVRLWADGVLQGSGTGNTTPLWSGGSVTGVGQHGNLNQTYNWQGAIDELRVSSTVRYTTAFTPPAAAFTVDGATTGLFHFDRTGAADNAAAVTGSAKIWTGTGWVAKPVKVWTGTAWVAKPVKRWTGTAWVTTPY